VFSDNFEPGVISSKVRMNSCESAEKILTTNDFEESQSLYINRIALKESSFGNSLHPVGSFDSGCKKVRRALEVDVWLTF